MKSYAMSRLLLLLFLCGWYSVHGLCLLKKQTLAECADLEDARYIDTYQLHSLRASSSAETLSPGNFKNLTTLRHLDLSNGNIETIETASFAKLNSLMTLNLADNHIAHLEAGAFDGLKQLRNLRLSANKIRQLPSALLMLKELRYLDVSDNPLNCNCASMKLRDALLARDVKISKKTRCVEPISSKGLSLLKPDTKMTCVFESQDMEMQGDQPIEDGSGDEKEAAPPVVEDAEETTAAPEVSSSTEADVSSSSSTESETPSPATSSVSSSTEEQTVVPSVSSTTEEEAPSPSEASPSLDPILTTLAEVSSTEDASSSTVGNNDETTKVSTSESSLEEQDDEEDIDAADVHEIKQDLSTQATLARDLGEASGDTDDEGSGAADDDAGSGIDAIASSISPVNVPEINYNDTFENASDGNEDADSTAVSSTSATPTTTDSGWWGVWDALNPFGPEGESTTTTTTSTTEKNPVEQVLEEEFIPTVTEPPKDVVETPVVPKIAVPDESSKNVDQPATGDSPPDAELAADSSPSQEPQKGSGSYYVLATLLAILAILIAFAAYKGDFCKKKRKRSDVERGTEMKDMQKSLLEQNAAAQPKVQVANGNTMENVPLMNSTTTPEEPKGNQKSYDITTAPAVTNGANKPNWAVDDPVKPPRKGYGQEIEAPLNGLNPPMDDIDGPTNGLDEVLSNGDVPPLSPGAQRVKITMGELPESVPKTPILITRLKNGDNLVKTP